ncbi:MAG: bis(5'-nucleosyl)-tetraphosphatase (symmetrical) YqeK [Acholeplasmataceae bacterium]
MKSDLITLAKEQVNEKLKAYPKRLKHVYGVAETAVKLAKIYGVDQDKMMLIGLYHDFAKYDLYDETFLTQEEIQIVKNYPVLFHAYQGAYLLRENLKIEDKEMISAIKCHVFGKPKMTVMEKILFISDYCEPNRTYFDTNEIFLMASKDLDQTVKYCMLLSIKDLTERKLLPSEAQIEAYNYYVEVSNG